MNEHIWVWIGLLAAFIVLPMSIQYVRDERAHELVVAGIVLPECKTEGGE